jgi:hypoxanthine-DNA glycosylase
MLPTYRHLPLVIPHYCCYQAQLIHKVHLPAPLEYRGGMVLRQSPRLKNTATPKKKQSNTYTSKRNLSTVFSLAAPLAAISCASALKTPLDVADPRKQRIKSLLVKKTSPSTTKTSSFGALWAGNFTELQHENVQVHTLILGTHPSITSLEENRYFGHPMNAFWWIAGDCLGFRRNDGLSVAGEPLKFTSQLRHGRERVIPYPDQIRIFASKGFALWDVVKECQREGSLDSAIKGDVPNDIRGFCEHHPSINRIIFANGGTSCAIFNKHFTDWWLSGELKPGTNAESIKAFGKFGKRCNQFGAGRIECISAISVSPAAARYSYSQKRDFWDEFVYVPGLNAYNGQQSVDSPASVRDV